MQQIWSGDFSRRINMLYPKKSNTYCTDITFSYATNDASPVILHSKHLFSHPFFWNDDFSRRI